MNVTFAPKGIMQIDDARITFKNFAGAAGMYNREGERSFALVINSQEVADAMIKEGWNVKIKPPREDGDDPFMYLTVKVAFNDYGPNVYLQSGKNLRKLDAETAGIIDHVRIVSADLDIRPYDWNINGKSGRTAYLQSIRVTQDLDRFAEDFEDAQVPFDY